MPVPLIDLKAQIKPLRQGILEDWAQILDSGAYILGPHGKAFEAEAAKYLKVKHAIACNSGTDALFILLKALGIGPGDEVIVPAFSFFATAEAVSIVGAKPVFCDIRPDDCLLDVEGIKALLNKKTKAVIPVHLYGRPMDLGPLKRLLKGRKVAILEDACQAFGAKQGKDFAGALGDAAAFSFYPTKNLSAAGDSGLMTTNDDKVAELARQLREHGSPKRYVHEHIGFNSRMDELQAAVLRRKLPFLKSWTQSRRRIAQAYAKALQKLPIGLPPASTSSVWHQYTIRVPQGRRDALKAHLESLGIASAIFYPGPMNRQTPYRKFRSHTPHAEQASREVLCLPIFPEMTGEQLEAVASGIWSFFRSA